MLIESVCASFLSHAPGYLLTNVNQRFLPAQLIFLSQMTKTIISDAIKRVISKEEKANPITHTGAQISGNPLHVCSDQIVSRIRKCFTSVPDQIKTSRL